MHGIDAESRQVLNGPGLRQGQELTGMLGCWLGDGEIAVVHLVDDEVLGRTTHWLIVLPPVRVAVAHIDDNSFLAIDSNSLGEYSRRGHTVDHEFIGLAFVVTKSRDRPYTIVIKLHVQAVVAKLNIAVGISRGEQPEDSLVGRVGHLVEMKGLLARAACHHRQRHHTYRYQFLHFLSVFRGLAIKLTAKPPPGASLIFNVCPALTVFFVMV